MTSLLQFEKNKFYTSKLMLRCFYFKVVIEHNKPDEIVDHTAPISFLHLKNNLKFEKKSFDMFD